MSLPISAASPPAPPQAVPHVIPRYLESVYWWAYVHPRAVQVFERGWLVNTILFGHYATLRDHALAALADPGQPGQTIRGRTLQLACVYGTLTPRLLGRLAPDATLEVVDVLPIQLRNLQAKLPADDPRVTLTQSDSSALRMPDASVDQVLLFFLLHEQPEAVRRGTLAEALRVCKPGGRVVIVDYHSPVAWHPVRPLMTTIFRKLEPYAMDLWQHPVQSWLPPEVQPTQVAKRTWFGGLYQQLILQR